MDNFVRLLIIIVVCITSYEYLFLRLIFRFFQILFRFFSIFIKQVY